MTTIIIASGNAHKAEEIQKILGLGFSYETLKDHPEAPEPEETEDTFEGNSSIKAESLAHWLAETNRLVGDHSLILADDSGLEVDILDKAPGVHSARYAGLDTGAHGNSPDSENNAKLLRVLAGMKAVRPTGRFRCVLSLVEVSGGNDTPSFSTPMTFSGAVEGVILDKLIGENGFGYDPLFIPNGYETSFGELSEEIKNSLSHRATAVGKLKEWLDAK